MTEEKTIKTEYKEVSADQIKPVQEHHHNGLDSPRINPKDLMNAFYQTVSVVPTAKPNRLIDQIQIYVSGGTVLLYVWDNTNSLWRRFNYYTP